MIYYSYYSYYYYYYIFCSGLPQQDRNIASSYGLDNYFGQSSHFQMTENVGTSSNFHVSPTFDADDCRYVQKLIFYLSKLIA